MSRHTQFVLAHVPLALAFLLKFCGTAHQKRKLSWQQWQYMTSSNQIGPLALLIHPVRTERHPIGHALTFRLAIFGPPIHLTPKSGKDLQEADTSTARTYEVLAGGSDAEIPHTSFPVWAEAEAVAQGLYEIIARRKNGRYIICNGTFDFDMLNRTAQKLRPDLVKAGVIPRGEMDGDTPISGGCYTMDSTKSQKELGIKCKSNHLPNRSVVTLTRA